MSDTPRTDALCEAIARGEVNDYSALRDLAMELETALTRIQRFLDPPGEEPLYDMAGIADNVRAFLPKDSSR